MVSQQLQASVVEELENRDILPNKYVSNIIENKSDLSKHVADATTGDQAFSAIPTTVTSDINYWRNKFRNKMPVSESSVASAIEDGIEKVITPDKVQSKSGHKNLADLLKKLGIKQIEFADDICMALV